MRSYRVRVLPGPSLWTERWSESKFVLMKDSGGGGGGGGDGGGGSVGRKRLEKRVRQ